MKIRPSLKLHFFFSVVLLGSSMVIGFSFLSVNYFVDGLDRSLNGIMFEIAKTTEVEDQHPKIIAGIHVASRWQDTPKLIRQHFPNPPSEVGQLLKIKDQATILSMPKNLYFVVLYHGPNGEERFISKVMLEKDFVPNYSDLHPTNRLIWTAIVAIIAILLFALLLVMIMLKVTKPLESLKSWAKSLDKYNLHSPPPDFTFNELNVLASLVQSSLVSAHQSLEREQRFLSYASHELRTPIAVIRSNVDLLQRINEKVPTSEKQKLTLERIQRAGLTMTNLTDTFLWLSRNEELNVAPETVKLDEKIRQACCDLNYLLSGKDVEVKVETEECEVNTVAVACHIVINNLIRNAYQHTQHGEVKIEQQGSRVIIINTNTSNDNTSPMVDSNDSKVAFGYGYGLGLQLSEKIINHHEWHYEKTSTPGFYQVTIDFNGHN
ncbi:HAMP domain-containing sensor histidine kinase [Aliiglaciecola sp. NS0011-25]|uniref:sensor histidine kinase n=1 Tax=Aliiglaciecola sp. NS0011-25 TaxID=3127654 RepID=UPI00333E431E